MANGVISEIQKEYLQKRAIAEKIAESKRKEIYKSIPELIEIDKTISEASIKYAKSIINSSLDNREKIIEELENDIIELKRKKDRLISEKGYDINDIEINYECQECKDTGYLTMDDGSSEMCNCMKQKILNKSYKQDNLRVEDENFASFDIGYYSNKPNKQKYNTESSPKENILYIKNVSENFIANFDDPTEKNLLFVGSVGTGKTFLINCIAKELIKQGKTILYQTAPILMDMIMENKFKQNTSEGHKKNYNNIFDVDLIIIDDLGTETLNESRFTELFNILNTRLLKDKKMIISTNLDLRELYQVYEERIVSRIIGNFTICKFIGEDIRLLKRQLNQ